MEMKLRIKIKIPIFLMKQVPGIQIISRKSFVEKEGKFITIQKYP